MKLIVVKYCLQLLCCLSLVQSIAQVDTISSYHTLSASSFLSSADYAVQTARILPDRPCTLNSFRIHLSGGKGSCRVHVYGHEGGNTIPSAHAKDLVPVFNVTKTQEGDTIMNFDLLDGLYFENDQFFISLDYFEGDFGVKQDTSYFGDFCSSNSGGNFNPSYLLSKKTSKFVGNDFHMAIDAIVSYDLEHQSIFREVTLDVGLPTDIARYTAAWADVNNDYWKDLLLGQHLYINKGGTFEYVSLDETRSSRNFIKKSAFIDMNNDGHWDIIIFAGARSWLLLNDGEGEFIKHILDIPPLTSLEAFSIADINQDQYPDLVLAQLWGNYPEPKPNFLLLNDGALNFKNITTRLYPYSDDAYNFPDGTPCIGRNSRTYLPDQNRNRRSRATQFIDYDQDGDEDLYVTNYFLETDEFYENDGQGFFTSIKAPKPINQSDMISNHGTGVSWYDFDNDGDFDVLVPQLAHPRNMVNRDHRGTTLYNNQGGSFEDVTTTSGIHYEETHAGANFGDVNNDGLIDLLTTVYYGCRFVDLYLQQVDHSFKMSTKQAGFSNLSTGSEVSFVDYNNDGKLDIALGKEGSFRLFENTFSERNNWMKLDLICRSRNHFGIGAIVKVYAGGQIYTQQVVSGRGQGMQSPTTLHFGLGQTTLIDKVEVLFGKKLVARMENVNVNATYLLEVDY